MMPTTLKVKTAMWELDDAIALVRQLQPGTREYGYHLALGGGVLNNGRSNKDLDLYFIPLDSQDTFANFRGLLAWLEQRIGAAPTPISAEEDNYPEQKALSVYRAKVKFVGKNGTRIDAFIMKGTIEE